MKCSRIYLDTLPNFYIFTQIWVVDKKRLFTRVFFAVICNKPYLISLVKLNFFSDFPCANLDSLGVENSRKMFPTICYICNETHDMTNFICISMGKIES